MQRRMKFFVALGAVSLFGLVAVADSAFADRKRGHDGMHSGYHQGMMARHGGQRHGTMARHGGQRHATMARQFRSLAERYDLNQDGEITQEEIDQNRTEWHAEFDADGEGLTLEEFQDLWLKARFQQMVREFQRFDRDGDGRITLEEYLRPMSDFVERFDRTGSESLTRQDFQRDRRGMRDRRDQRGRWGRGAPQSPPQQQE
jgi:Ca2+-binding EF-hand superfamily protein